MDLQPRLLSSIHNADQLIKTNSILGQASVMLEIPIIITEQVPDKLGHTENSVSDFLDLRNLIKKDTFSAFGSNDFCKLLNESNSKRIILAGIETSICIYLTAVDAMIKGYEVTIISDAIGCRREADGERCLNQLQLSGAEIIPLETLLFNKLKSSAHPNFKSISGLIKSRE